MTDLIPFLAQASPPAGGAAIGQVVIATAAAMIVTGGLFALGYGHRTGRTCLLERLGAFTERQSGIPGWAALPAAVITGALLVALFGMLWDISIHIDEGRDEGPLANPAHYFILGGLFGVFAAGFLAIVMPKERPGPTAIRISGDWYAPIGGILIAACGAFSLIGFPLDDVWHRLFGQDVTLWGPTHLMLIGGAAMTLIGLAVLLVEGSRANESAGRDRDGIGWVRWVRNVALTGAFLLGLSTFQAEFDFGVPQFRFVFAPMLVMLAAGVSLVAARVWLGRGAAIGAALFFLVVRGSIALIVGPVLGETTPHFPLYLGSAIVVELIALWVSSDRPLRFALIAGAGIGTLGLASEWAFAQTAPIPWPSELLPEGAILGFAMAIAGSLLGAWMGARLASDHLPRTRSLRYAAIGAAVAVGAMVLYGLHKPADEGVRGTIAIAEAGAPPGEGVVTVALDPPDAAQDAEWFQAISWQGGGLVLDDMQPTGEPGTYRTSGSVPLDSDWKTLVRLQKGDSLTGLPVYLPEDEAIPVDEVPATDATREFIADYKILQREQLTAAPGLWAAGYGIVLLITLSFLMLIAWGLHRLAVTAERPDAARSERKTSATAPAIGGPIEASP
ncbi:MAG: hypothetical protein ACHQCI_04355 [Solirubrobacterales bacterium]|jgi:hypothetical protein